MLRGPWNDYYQQGMLLYAGDGVTGIYASHLRHHNGAKVFINSDIVAATEHYWEVNLEQNLVVDSVRIVGRAGSTNEVNDIEILIDGQQCGVTSGHTD